MTKKQTFGFSINKSARSGLLISIKLLNTTNTWKRDRITPVMKALKISSKLYWKKIKVGLSNSKIAQCCPRVFLKIVGLYMGSIRISRKIATNTNLDWQIFKWHIKLGVEHLAMCLKWSTLKPIKFMLSSKWTKMSSCTRIKSDTQWQNFRYWKIAIIAPLSWILAMLSRQRTTYIWLWNTHPLGIWSKFWRKNIPCHSILLRKFCPS